MRAFVLLMRLCASVILLACGARCFAATGGAEICPRPNPGAAVEDPPEVSSRSGMLELSLTLRDQRLADGSRRYCYLTPDGKQSPTLRVHPGDEVVLKLRNALSGTAANDAGPGLIAAADGCPPRAMTPDATNLHFHGLALAARCHEDDVLETLIRPGDPPFEYHFRIPADEAPGLYWYHAHAHGLTAAQVGGGASGALIVEDARDGEPRSARGLRQRVLVVRDQALLHPDAPPSQLEPSISPSRRDRDGDAGNSGTGYGKPARDLSVNFVPVPYPDYPPARLIMRGGERQLWRLVNASSVTYLNLALMVRGVAQPLEVVAVDGVPLDWRHPGAAALRVTDHVGLAPGARMEFIVHAPPAGEAAQLVTRAVDTGPDGENDPNRLLLAVTADGGNGGRAKSSTGPAPDARPDSLQAAWIGDVEPSRTRHFFFWETPVDPAHPEKPAAFYLTQEGHPLRVFDPAATQPDVEVRQGDVEDWVIENRTRELHVFHIHQLHFQVRDWFGLHVNESFVRDTVNVPFYDFQMPRFPSVTLRMDFRGTTATGTFVYHCHLLDHEDAGMMGTIRVEPSSSAVPRTLARAWEDLYDWLRARLEAAGLTPSRAQPAPGKEIPREMCRPAGRPINARRVQEPRADNARYRAARSAEAPWSSAARVRFADVMGMLPRGQAVAPSSETAVRPD